MKKTISLISISVLILLAVACSDTKNDDDASIYNKAIACVVEVQVRDSDNIPIGNATGSVISKDGLILTNKHVVRKYNYTSNEYDYHENFFIRFFDEDSYTKVDLIRYSETSDLALLQLETKTANFFKIGNSENLRAGEKIHTIGNGNGFGLAYANGNIAAPLRIVNYEFEFIEAIQLSLIINEGNSGGPLISTTSELVGITTFRLRDSQNNIVFGTSFALPTNTIRAFLDVEVY